MTPDTSVLSFMLNAGLVVKIVMMILFTASIFSWTVIFQRIALFKKARSTTKDFETRFWSGIDLTELAQEYTAKKDSLIGLSAVFQSGFDEFLRLKDALHIAPEHRLENISRAMRAAQSRELSNLERNLPFLATLGSTGPYVGLFGTVWGIMTSFQALGGVQQATISMVAPGISEALIATAMGLFAAIPAVIAYNRFANSMERTANQYDAFQEEFINILQRQIQH